MADPLLDRQSLGAPTRRFLRQIGLPGADAFDLPTSPKRFPDGGQYRLEVPSTEGPDAMEAVLKSAAERDLTIHRVSQGSGVMLQTDVEIQRMVALGADAGVEVCLFVGPRAGWDIGVQAQSPSGRALGASLRGAEALVHGIEDVRRACELGVRSVLVADVGQLSVLGKMKAAGDLPADLVLKVSVMLPVANPATARVFEDLGATSLNLPVDLALPQIAAIRQAVDVPVDVYMEAPDDFGAPVRYYEVPELVRVAAPVYVKHTVRNSPGIYPSGRHLEATVIALAEERVRRSALAVAMIKRYYPEAVASPGGLAPG